MKNCSACDSGLNPGTSGGGKRRRGKKHQRGGALSSLIPASLNSSDSFDRAGNVLAKTAHNLYVKQNYELAALKNQNAMMGGGGRKKTAKKYRSRSKSKSKQQRGGILELGALINDAAVPFTLLAAQQKYGKRRGTKARKSRKFRSSRRR